MTEQFSMPINFLKLMQKSASIIEEELDDETISGLTEQYNYSLDYISKNPSNFKVNKFINLFYNISDEGLEGDDFGIVFGNVIDPFVLGAYDKEYVVNLLSMDDLFYPDQENPFSDNFYQTGITDIFLEDIRY